MTERKWLAECHAWLDDPESVQYELTMSTGRAWEQDERINPITHPHVTWRIKPKTLTINGEEFERPIEGMGNHCFSVGKGDERAARAWWFNSREARDAVYKKLVEVLSC